MLFTDIDMITFLVGIRDLLILLRAVRRVEQELGVVDPPTDGDSISTISTINCTCTGNMLEVP
jgi:hypothetical protein